MQKGIIMLLLLVQLKNSVAQNIGIGTGTPTARLHINHRNTGSSPALRLFDSTAGTGSSILFAKESQGNNFSIVSTISTFAADNALDFRTTFSSGIFLRGDGRVGINSNAPTARLHVGGGVKITDTLNVTGDVNITGKLKVNNNAGTAGQVLVSQGTGNSPEWATSSFPADERAWIRLAETNASELAPYSATVDFFDTDYNTSTANINLASNTITINKAGLYRFHGSFGAELFNTTFQSGDYPKCIISLVDDGVTVRVADEPVYALNVPIAYRGRVITFSLDRYISAGSIISASFNFTGIISTTGPVRISGSNYFAFHLIAE